MNKARNFKELVVWRKAMNLAKQVYTASDSFPSDERFGLISQMRRSAVSIPSNIAEGQARTSTGEFKQFLGIARGSLAELETQAQLALELEFLVPDSHQTFDEAIQETGRILNGLINSLATSH